MSSRTKTIIFTVFILVLGFILGKATNSSSVNSEHSQQESSSKTVTSWTCSMHPQINLPKKGKCPICSMDLIPVASSSSDDEGERVLKMTKASMKLADISTQAIEKREAFVNLNLFGKVAVDTTRIPIWLF